MSFASYARPPLHAISVDMGVACRALTCATTLGYVRVRCPLTCALFYAVRMGFQEAAECCPRLIGMTDRIARGTLINLRFEERLNATVLSTRT